MSWFEGAFLVFGIIAWLMVFQEVWTVLSYSLFTRLAVAWAVGDQIYMIAIALVRSIR